MTQGTIRTILAIWVQKYKFDRVNRAFLLLAAVAGNTIEKRSETESCRFLNQNNMLKTKFHKWGAYIWCCFSSFDDKLDKCDWDLSWFICLFVLAPLG